MKRCTWRCRRRSSAHDDAEVRGFCAGQDLGDRDPRKGGPAPDLGHTIEAFYNPTLRPIRQLEKPVIAAVNGVAAGTGANIAFAKIGLVPDAGGSWSLARILGEPRAKALALTAEPLPAEKAADWALIWRAVDDANLMGEATRLAESLATGPTLGIGLTKRLIQSAATSSLDEQLDMERDLQQQAGRSADCAQGSPPSWKSARQGSPANEDRRADEPARACRSLGPGDVE
jgi:2-(1,2-epoxy-1,2-dihydrophenyl)acetyl-CoA isomerase